MVLLPAIVVGIVGVMALCFAAYQTREQNRQLEGMHDRLQSMNQAALMALRQTQVESLKELRQMASAGFDSLQAKSLTERAHVESQRLDRVVAAEALREELSKEKEEVPSRKFRTIDGTLIDEKDLEVF